MSHPERSRSEPCLGEGGMHDADRLDRREHEQEVLQAIRDTTFGTIEVTVHQSRIVQITRSEKLRF